MFDLDKLVPGRLYYVSLGVGKGKYISHANGKMSIRKYHGWSEIWSLYYQGGRRFLMLGKGK